MTTEDTDNSDGRNAARLVRSRYEQRVRHLARISELQMRSPAVRETIVTRQPAEAAYWLDQMIRGAIWGREYDLDALLGFVFWLVRNPRGGKHYEFLEQLYRIAHEHDVRTVLYLLQNPPPHQALASEARLPDVRLPLDRDDITVGERRTIARKGSRDIVKRLTLDPHPLVIENVLENTDTTESDVLKIAARRPTKPAILRRVVQHTDWFGRLNVRKALVLNPYNDTGMSLKLLPTIGIDALRNVRFGSDVHENLGDAAEYLVDMRETHTSPWEV